jgi:hypothetical protein
MIHLLRGWLIVSDDDVTLLDDPLTSLGEGEVLLVLHQLDGIALSTTYKALETASLGAEMKRGVLVFVIRTTGTTPFIAHTIEFHAEFIGHCHDACIVNLT